MPIADLNTYCAMLDRAHTGGFALPAVNVTSLTILNAALAGLAESKANGVIQISTGGGAFSEKAMTKPVGQPASDLGATGKTMFPS